MNNIYLIGFMGTGKTAVGKELARRKKMHFVDLDLLIEKKAKKQIAEIFAQEGERYFRKLEKEMLRKVSRQGNCAVSCGGGIAIDPENIKIMKSSGTLICLKAKPEVILARTRKFCHRPLLNVPNPKKTIISLLKKRSVYYARADKTIDTSNISVKVVARRIIALTAK